MIHTNNDSYEFRLMRDDMELAIERAAQEKLQQEEKNQLWNSIKGFFRRNRESSYDAE